jgi:hypothetical protein
MAYHSYVKSVQRHLSTIENPSVLEIGLNVGEVYNEIAKYLCENKQEFSLFGVDVIVQGPVRNTIDELKRTENQRCELFEENSLSFLPNFVQMNKKLDVWFIDGDHNYYTVSNELTYVDKITHDKSVIILDDYFGRFSERDFFYSEEHTHSSCDIATKRINTEKHGVRPAVDEFLANNQKWFSKPDPLMPIVLCKDKDILNTIRVQ